MLYLQNFTMAAIKDWGGEWLAVTWSLAIEEQFYLLAPLLVWLFPLRYLCATLLGLIVLSPILRTVALFATGGPMAAYVLLPCRWDALCIGMLIATQIHVYGYEARLRGNKSMSPQCWGSHSDRRRHHNIGLGAAECQWQPSATST